MVFLHDDTKNSEIFKSHNSLGINECSKNKLEENN